METIFCLICYKSFPKNLSNLDNCKKKERKDLLKRFYRLLSRHFNTKNGGEANKKDFIKKSEIIMFEKLIDDGMGSCENCFNFVDSFCDLYHLTKSMELLLSWRVWSLTNIMKSSQKNSSRIQDHFKMNLSELKQKDQRNLDEILDTFISCNEKFVRRGNLKLLNAYPRLYLKKCDEIEKPGHLSVSKMINEDLENSPEDDMILSNSSDSTQQEEACLVNNVARSSCKITCSLRKGKSQRGKLKTVKRRKQSLRKKKTAKTTLSKHPQNNEESCQSRIKSVDSNADVLKLREISNQDKLEEKLSLGKDSTTATFPDRCQVLCKVHRCTNCCETFSSTKRLSEHCIMECSKINKNNEKNDIYSDNFGQSDVEISTGDASCSSSNENELFSLTENEDGNDLKEIITINPQTLQKFKCPDCDILFDYLTELILHRSQSHPVPDNLVLKGDLIKIDIVSLNASCSMESSTSFVEQEQIFARVEVPQKVFRCSVNTCQREYCFKEELDIHLQLHNGPFYCNFCKHQVNFAPNLSEHEVTIHTNVKNSQKVICSRCQSSFDTKDLYIFHHLQEHLSLLVYPTRNWKGGVCSICKVTCVNIKELVAHLKAAHDISHILEETAIKRCRASGCHAYFLEDGLLEMHQETMHSIDSDNNTVSKLEEG